MLASVEKHHGAQGVYIAISAKNRHASTCSASPDFFKSRLGCTSEMLDQMRSALHDKVEIECCQAECCTAQQHVA